MVFGTKNLIRAVLIPSIKMLPYSGLEWSRLCDRNYKVKGCELESEIEIEENNCLRNEEGNRESNHMHREDSVSIFENEFLKDIEI